jgi:hypothetical protein
MDESRFIELMLDLLPIYTTGKDIIIEAEEGDDSSKSNISVFKEQRDALDHLVRAIAAQWGEQSPSLASGRDDYIVQQFSKARGHLFRAAYDALDGYSVILRKRILEDMTSFSNDAIVACFPDYYTTQHQTIQQAAFEVAARRRAKDIGDSETFNNLEEYRKTVKSLKSVRDACRAKIPSMREWSKRDGQNIQRGRVWDIVKTVATLLIGAVITWFFSKAQVTPTLQRGEQATPAAASQP